MVAVVTSGCLQDNPRFSEPVPLYGACSLQLDDCEDDLVCLEVVALDEAGMGTVCSQFACDGDNDCPDGDDGTARAVCRGNNLCVLDCSPRPCQGQNACAPCPDGLDCAPGCGPSGSADTSSHCLACPAGMECIPVGESMGFNIFQCGHR